jgi:hypothetical protein
LIVENDCVSVTVSNQKASYAKTCSLALKAGDVYYPGAVAPGDWMFVWMSEFQDDIDSIINSLNAMQNGSLANVNGFDSGLKFVGRVTEVLTDEIAEAGGQKTVTQHVNGQAFTEFLSSVYFTASAQAFFVQQIGFGNTQTASNVLISNGMDTALKNLGQAFIQFFTKSYDQTALFPPPDVAIGFYLTIVLGINKDNPLVAQISSASGQGVIGDAIDVPPAVARILGKPNAKKTWQLLNIYLGVQKYSNKSTDPSENFSPEVQEVLNVSNESVFFESPYRCKGWVPFYPTPWDNKSLWAVISEYLNPVVNEMYTVLRIDQFGRILPCMMVREQPFGTNLFNQLKNQKIQPPGSSGNASTSGEGSYLTNNQTGPSHDSGSNSANNIRADYASHPRWVIDEGMIRSWDIGTHERNRVNFVQVWGRSTNLDIITPALNGRKDSGSIETFKDSQLAKGNMVSDDQDIRRHGLRANIMESSFDMPIPAMSEAPFWARMRADWLFNGHLKAEGTITMNGVRYPICEGDNLEARGIVFHIESVSHSGAIDAGGKKRFVTTVNVSRGIMAYSLDKPDLLPAYLPQQGSNPDSYFSLPGVTDVQATTKKNRSKLGDKISSTEEG